MTQWQDRIIETREGDPAELVKMLHPDNPKSHPEGQMEGVEHSLKKVGWIDRPIWNQRTNYFLDGNGRVTLALMAGQASIKYDVVDLSPEEEQYVLLTFDPLGGMAEPDAVKLLALLNQVGEDLPEAVAEHLLGMVGEVEETTENGQGEEPQLDRAAELQEKWGVETGQLWQLGEQHRLICGDCTDKAVVERVMGGEKATFIWADPPYGMGLDVNRSNLGLGDPKRVSQHPRMYTSVIGDNRLFDRSMVDIAAVEEFWWGGDYYIESLPNYGKDGAWLVWDKREGIENMEYSSSSFELCWSKNKHRRDILRYRWAGLLGMEREDTKSRMHPTQKPVILTSHCLERYGNNDDMVIDPFLGSGTTLIACHNLNRQCRAVEISPAYVAVTLQRFYDHTNLDPVLLEDPQ